jgi:KUP system potassium uptake protein
MNDSSDHKRLGVMTLAALGVVYGDIGTSPLYTVREIFAGSHHPVPINPDNILGILSLIFWTLVMVVSAKYATFIMRADNRGEGGIMALMALVKRHTRHGRQAFWLVLLGLFGASLFYGDGVITPAISVLSAVEGLGVATSAFKPWILPLTILILFGLFWVQKHGTALVGGLFGPITTLWFLVLAAMGIHNIIQAPMVLAALSPHHAAQFFLTQPHLAFMSLGSVFLAVTGAEALYADMGHFGRTPVRLAWLGLVLPALTLNYFGQGALLLVHPETIKNPFFLMAPDWALYPLVALSTAATVIASQAVISGAYSITHQAIQMGYVPRMQVLHTSSEARGQIYMPAINWGLFVAVVLLVLGFGSADAIASAYGISVAGTMIITTLLVYVAARRIWRWGPVRAGLVLGTFLIMDLAFFSANLSKIADGGWFPLSFALTLFILMTTWKRGRDLLKERRDQGGIPLREFVQSMGHAVIPTISGTAVFLTPNPRQVPHSLLHSLKHYKSLHERVVIMNVRFTDEPYIAMEQRVHMEHLAERFYRVEVCFGFMDLPDLTATLHACDNTLLPCDLEDTTFFLGRELLSIGKAGGMAVWRKKLFIGQSRLAGTPASWFNLPVNRVVELGAQVVL